MNQYLLSLIAFVGGVFLAAQGGLNAQLSVLLKSPLLASVAAFSSSLIFAITFVLLSIKEVPKWEELTNIPYYMWFVGGLCSVIGLSLYYYTIPRLGIATMISLGLCGQLLFSVVASQFGWLNLPIEPITLKKAFGVLSMIIGIVLINLK
ncbi:DMT family transporter [Flammeovirgaceae bacterium SG7u.111]|nr:DMT family transporter [Flammeovirgaceae bacterium SG7u.132]WPO37582.1 DMT family transporter [Flammeovirgaceae bacterium SG7u.111]